MGNLGNGHFRFFTATAVLIHDLRHVHFLAGTEAPCW